MSLIFKPTVAPTYKHMLKDVEVIEVAKDRSNKQSWNMAEINILINLRAVKLSHKECGERLKRSANSCSSVIHANNLYVDILKKRNELIEGFLNG